MRDREREGKNIFAVGIDAGVVQWLYCCHENSRFSLLYLDKTSETNNAIYFIYFYLYICIYLGGVNCEQSTALHLFSVWDGLGTKAGEDRF